MKNQQGVTIVELITVLVLTGFFTTLIAMFTISYWRYGYLLDADLSTLTTRLNASDFIRDSIGTSTGLIIQNSIPDSHTLSADPAQTSGNYWLPIHAIPGTTSMPAKGSVTPLVYYRRPSVNKSNSYIWNGSAPYEDEYILYLDGTTKSLMLRTLANPNTSNNKVRTSCPASFATVSCPADKTIATLVSSVTTRYFSRVGNTINWTSITDPNTGLYAGPDFPAVEVIEFKLSLATKTNLQTTAATQNSTIIRIALRNS